MKCGWWSFIGFVLVFAGCGATEIRNLRSDGAGGSGSNVMLDTFSTKSCDKIKMDLLFMIDNSPSMADKRDVLTAAVPDLVRRLVSPTCVDDTGTAVGQTPTDPAAPCPSSTVREIKPTTDLHVAVITSSLGGHGAPICEGTEAENDHAELLGSRPRAASTVYLQCRRAHHMRHRLTAGLFAEYRDWDGPAALARVPVLVPVPLPVPVGLEFIAPASSVHRECTFRHRRLCCRT
jgi:hypothetical protein